MRMNKFGEKLKAYGKAYCENRYTLDSFMSVPVLRHESGGGDMMRQRYTRMANELGAQMNGKCKVYPTYNPFSSAPLILYSE